MKLLVLIIAVIIMSFAESTHAESIEMQALNVPGYVDQEYEQLKSMVDEIGVTDDITDKKIEMILDLTERAPGLVDKQVEIIQKKQKLFELWEIRDKLIVCMQKKSRDCNKLKQELKSKQLTLLNSTPEIDEAKFEVTNLFIINKMKECSNITREFFPEFRAIVEVEFTIDDQGRPLSAFINQDKSAVSHDLYMFPKCVEHFARKLNFTNSFQKIASFSKNFIL